MSAVRYVPVSPSTFLGKIGPRPSFGIARPPYGTPTSQAKMNRSPLLRRFRGHAYVEGNPARVFRRAVLEGSLYECNVAGPIN